MEETRSWLDAQAPLRRNVGILEKLPPGSLVGGELENQVSSPQDSTLLLCAQPVVPALSVCHSVRRHHRFSRSPLCDQHSDLGHITLPDARLAIDFST